MNAPPQYSLRENLRSFPRAIWVLFIATFINRFGTFVMPFIVIYLSRQGYSATKAGIAVSAYGAGHLVASMLGGHLADRIGRRNTIAISMFASSAMMVALSQARTYSTFLIVTLLAGAAAELYRPAAGALIGDLVPQERRVAAFAVYRFAVNLGFAFGPATAGFLADHSFLYLFLGDAATSFIYGIIALVALPHGLRSQTKHDEAPGGAIGHALRNPPFLLFLLATLSVMWVEFQIHSVFPLHLQSLGYATHTYGLLMSINGAIIVIFELALIAVTQRFPAQPMIACGYALSALGFALTGFARTIPALAATVVVWTLGEMVYAPVTGAYVTNLAPERYRGRYHGMWMLMWSCGMLIGPSLGTLLYSRVPSAYWITIAVVGLFGSSLVLIRLKPSTEMASERN